MKDPQFLQSQGLRLVDNPVGAQARALDMPLLFKLTQGEVADSIGVDRATEKDMEGEDDLLCEYSGSSDSRRQASSQKSRSHPSGGHCTWHFKFPPRRSCHTKETFENRQTCVYREFIFT
ncbi:hypothetical protein FPANT_4005 [Fusarium pseudoanthophilum]|uniref:Uncharacterized protein n=1 Tax=Fusarium pseudoanthophilum TaxID=48495 RepID=A0A8H5PJT8_9HYPO|nr:hypothetical protein FPANT_4005 [Fusarium pseudoanthophilum]